jgi:putative oxidoreductase
MNYVLFLQTGLGEADLALFLNRLALGLFFVFSGYHKLFNKQRHATLVATLTDCGVRDVAVMQWFVPCVEFFGGLALLSGVLAPLASLGLVCVCAVACLTDGRKRVASYQPIDAADYCDDVLYLPEFLYIVGLLLVIVLGPGSITLPHLVLGL